MKTKAVPTTMKAVAIDAFGNGRKLRLRTLPVPTVDAGEVLIRLEWAGVGEWDPFEREGGFAKMLGLTPHFPLILGSEGAGVVAAVGAGVRRLAVGDRVYASGFLNPKGGFYAEYAVVSQDTVARVPRGLRMREAAVMSGVGLTALRGLDDTLHLKKGEQLLIYGASGALGHLAVQLAQRRGARVVAIASGKDGVALVRALGAEIVLDGHAKDLATTLKSAVPEGVDAALIVGSGPQVRVVEKLVRRGGRLAFPSGVRPEPGKRAGVKRLSFDGDPDADIMRRLARANIPRPLRVHVDATFPLQKAAHAHRAVAKHHVGKLALQIR